ncbi:hypothetical protein DEO72_LG8g660 [Vigna unguiculata]|uniref:Transmembrane protein n=1 Tax=Vigna unguiculata TaxID=3917 RepID=A0A4D6MRY2_VIGUN|nr:hypothetical protein DEO72_LG8g660 [Vigna unguiculata]
MGDRAFGMREARVTYNIGNIQIRNMAIETNPVHALLAFIFFVLLAFLQLRYPENPTPFHLHPNTTWISILSFLLYCFAFLGNLKFGTRVHHFETLMHVFGSLSLLCLVVLLLPDSWEGLGFVIYVLWFITCVLPAIRTHSMETRVQRQNMSVVRPVLPITSMDLF